MFRRARYGGAIPRRTCDALGTGRHYAPTGTNQRLTPKVIRRTLADGVSRDIALAPHHFVMSALSAQLTWRDVTCDVRKRHSRHAHRAYGVGDVVLDASLVHAEALGAFCAALAVLGALSTPTCNLRDHVG